MHKTTSLLRIVALLVVLTLPSLSNAQPASTVKAGRWQLDADAFDRGVVDGLRLQSDGLSVTAGTTGTYTSPPIQADFEFIALGVTWSPPLPDTADVGIAVRTRADAAAWTDWATLATDLRDAPEFAQRTGTELHFARGQWLQLRVTIRDVTVSGQRLLPDLAVTYLDSRAGPSSEEFGTTQASGAPPVVTRAEWGADESLRFDDEGNEVWPPAYQTPEKVIVHHTATSNDIPDPPAVVRAIYYFHAVERGWGDIGYNFLVDHDGRVYEGRYGGEQERRLVVAGHAHRYNPGSIGVAVLGTFQPGGTPSGVPLPADAETTLGELIAYRGNRYGIHPLENGYFIDGVFDNVLGHRDIGASTSPTACPGDYAYDRLDAIRQSAWATIETLPPEVYFSAPAGGAVLTDTVTIEPILSPTVDRIDLRVDDTSVATDDEAPFEATLDPDDYAPGEHTVTVVAYGLDGQQAEQTHPFTIDGSIPPHFLPLVLAAPENVVTPTPEPTCTNLLANGGMEQDTGWTLSVEDDYNWTNPAAYVSVPHSGSRSVFVGLEEGVTSSTPRWASARQTVDLPAESEITLSLYYRPESEAGAEEDEWQYVILLDETGTTLELLHKDREDGTGWQPFEADLSAYAGETVEVYLGVKNDGAGGSTRMYVDDVVVCADADQG